MSKNRMKGEATMFKLSNLLRIASIAVLGLAISIPVSAQNKSSVGLGGQIGDPSGVTLKIRNPAGMSVDFMAAWASDDYFFLNVHGLYEARVGDVEDLRVFYGPGAYVGLRDRGDDDAFLGISATVGLAYLIEQFELFGQITPRLDLAPATDGEFGLGVGARFYFP